MCDYSLMSFPNRLAADGEELVVHRFTSGSIGLASAVDLCKPKEGTVRHHSWWAALKGWFLNENDRCVTAVCIPPAARLVLHDSSEQLRSTYGVQADEEVTFLELSADINTYRDALRFRNGKQVRLQELREGQRVTVLDLGGEGGEEGDLSQEGKMLDAVLAPVTLNDGRPR